MTDKPEGSKTPQEHIADEFLTVHQNSFGAGAQQVEAHMLGQNMVVVTIEGLEYTKGEQTLIEAGEQQSVLSVRAAFQRAIRPTFSAIIEHATGRQVRAFMSNTDLDEEISVEFFRLHPLPA